MNTNGKLNAANARSARDENLEVSAMMRWELCRRLVDGFAKVACNFLSISRTCRVGSYWAVAMSLHCLVMVKLSAQPQSNVPSLRPPDSPNRMSPPLWGAANERSFA